LYTATHSAIVIGVNGIGITVEADLTNGLPLVNVVGLPDSAVRESIERVRSAIRNSNFQFPLGRITINLAPAHIKKEGTGLDMAIAAAILCSSKQLSDERITNALIVGELALNGQVRPVHGLIAMLEFAKNSGITHIILPKDNVEEAQLISNLQIAAVAHLSEFNHLQFKPSNSIPASRRTTTVIEENYQMDLSDVIGQHAAKRALLIAATGRHNLFVTGPPGTGKTMLMQRLPTILPQLTEQEALQVTKIYSVAGKLSTGHSPLITSPPFRAPHHSISTGGLVGGGSIPSPGEITLAHHGVLFLDELPEFSRTVLELLRQPLEEHVITIARARQTLSFPADFLLAASFNPCPCGYFGYALEAKECTCTLSMIQRYRSKLSGPLLDRIDLHVEVPRLPSFQQTDKQIRQTSKMLRQQVELGRYFQLQRNKQYGFTYNNELQGHLKETVLAIPKDAEFLLQNAIQQLGMSMRGYDRILKIARTIADLEQSVLIKVEHVAEAIQYRKLDVSPTGDHNQL